MPSIPSFRPIQFAGPQQTNSSQFAHERSFKALALEDDDLFQFSDDYKNNKIPHPEPSNRGIEDTGLQDIDSSPSKQLELPQTTYQTHRQRSKSAPQPVLSASASSPDDAIFSLDEDKAPKGANKTLEETGLQYVPPTRSKRQQQKAPQTASTVTKPDRKAILKKEVGYEGDNDETETDTDNEHLKKERALRQAKIAAFGSDDNLFKLDEDLQHQPQKEASLAPRKAHQRRASERTYEELRAKFEKAATQKPVDFNFSQRPPEPRRSRAATISTSFFRLPDKLEEHLSSAAVSDAESSDGQKQ